MTLAVAHLAAAAASVADYEPLDVLPAALIAVTLAFYLAGLARRAAPRAQVVGCLLGLLLLAGALFGPVHARAESSFAWHMLQHEMLMVVAAPLLVIAHPLPVLLRGFPPRWRRLAIAPWRGTRWRTTWRWLRAPGPATLAHAVALWAWHLPAAFVAAREAGALHALQHASFLLTALLFWRAMARAGPPALLWLFLTMLHTTALGTLLTLASRPLYAPAQSAFGAALVDQQVGGLLMWIPGGTSYLLAALLVMVRLVAGASRAAQRTAGKPLEQVGDRQPAV